MEKTQRQMPQATNADDTDTVGGLNVQLDDRVKNSDTTTKKRPSLSRIQGFWQRDCPAVVSAHFVSKSTVTTDDGAFNPQTKIMVARHTPFTSETGTREPAQPNALTNFQSGDVVSYSCDRTNSFMASVLEILAEKPNTGHFSDFAARVSAT